MVEWLFVGLVAGMLAGKFSRGRGFGCLTDILLGLVGALLGGWVFTKFGIGSTASGDMLYNIAAATIGAVVVVLIARLIAAIF